MAQAIIAGAGPVGLFLARDLAIAGISVVVLEKESSPNRRSRATSIQARTVELFTMRGIGEPFIREGIAKPSYHFGGLTRLIDLSKIDSPHPYTLLIPQSRTEELLEKAALDAGVEIIRGYEVVDFEQDDSGVTVTARAINGQVIEFRSEYLVGADGGRSIVRKFGQFDFEGYSPNTYGFLIDVPLESPPSYSYIHHGEGYLMILPLTATEHRIVVIDKNFDVCPAPEHMETYVREAIKRISGSDFGLGAPVWLSRFSNTTRQVTEYRKGRVLLAGDAAHVHFPTGGVGLNLGIQDAANLGWKLAYLLRGLISIDDLDSYHAERHPIGAAVIQASLAQTALMTAFSPQGLAMRAWTNMMIDRSPELEWNLGQYISGLGIAYSNKSADAHVLTGCRVPNLRLNTDRGEIDLYSLFTDLNHVGIEFVPGALNAGPSGNFPLTRISVVNSQPKSREPWSSLDALLIRPDGYVSWARHQT